MLSALVQEQVEGITPEAIALLTPKKMAVSFTRVAGIVRSVSLPHCHGLLEHLNTEPLLITLETLVHFRQVNMSTVKKASHYLPKG